MVVWQCVQRHVSDHFLVTGMWDYRSQATVAEETLRRKAEKKLETLKHNLQVSQNDCQSLDAILAHVRASLQVCVCWCARNRVALECV